LNDEDLNTRQRYCLLRRQGYDDAEAAEQAGFSGRPGPDARRLWQAVQEEAGTDVPKRRLQLEKEVTQRNFQLEQLRRRLEALEVLRCE
jgi:hypothetical protein